jgi:two-component system sensor histidine kinase UhpB
VFWLTDPSKNQMLYVSPAYEEIWGRSCESLYQSPRSWMDSIHGEDRERIRQALESKQARGEYDEEYRVVRPDGSIRWIRDRAFPVTDKSGQVFRIAGVAEDVTERRRAEEALRAQATRLQKLSRRLREVEEAERRRINHELHDRIGQSLSALSLSLDLIRPELDKRSSKAVKLRLDAAQKLIEATNAQVRDLMAELHPPALDDYGLFAALRNYADTFAASAGVPIAVTGEDLVPRLAPLAEMALFRIAQEALVNAAKHASATLVDVLLTTSGGKVTLAISDNGRGFDSARVGTKRASWGLSIMRERAEAIGAQLLVESLPGRGTRVLVEIDHQPA